MLHSIFNYELRYWVKSPIAYLFTFVFFALSLVMMLGTGGFFDGPSEATENVRLLNSPFEINFIFHYLNKFLLFLLPVIVGTTLFKDYKSRTFHLTYAYPILKKDYLMGKLWSSLFIVVLISLFVGVALIIGEFILGSDNAKIGPFQLMGYLATYGVFVIPNLIIYGILVFIIVGISRNIYAGFITILILFLFQIIIENLFTGNGFLIALFDPLGQNTVQYVTKNWTLNNKNSDFIPVGGVVIYNRIFWSILIALVFTIFYRKFDFLYDSPFQDWKPSFLNKTKSQSSVNPNRKLDRISNVDYDYSTAAQFKSMWQLAVVDFKYIYKSWMFYLLAAAGILAVIFMQLKFSNTGEFNLLPLTRIMLHVPLFFYSLICMFTTFIYGGMLVHRAKNRRMNHLIDSTIISNWALLGSKLIALILMQISLLLLMMLCGMLIQCYNGYYNFEIGQYLFNLFILTLPGLIIWAVYTIFVHTLFPKLFVGLFILILTWIGLDGLNQIGIDTNLIKFNSLPVLSYSDFQGYGSQLKGHFLLRSYWLCGAIIFLVSSFIFWRRGVEGSILQRVTQAKAQLRIKPLIILAIALFGFFFLGFQVFQAESRSISDIGFEQTKGDILKNFRSKFKHYAQIEQPHIEDIQLYLDIYPASQKFSAKGQYLLVNQQQKAIDTLLIKTGFDESTIIKLSEENNVIQEDKTMQHTAYQLTKSMQPGDTIVLKFDIKNKENTLFTRNSNVIQNGTYIKQDILPRLGYVFGKEEIHPKDSTAKYGNFYYQDASNVKIETFITTSKDQIAFAPGNLLEQKVENNRNIFHYKTPEKVKLNFSFHSGQYQKYSEKYKGITIDIYGHENHNTNTKNMASGIKDALDYNTQYFDHYPYQQVRIIEYPHTEESYTATLMANNIPTSEILFTTNAEAMKDKINFTYYVMAHELTHEWFGNKVMPAQALGAKLLTESITEYISLQIYKKNNGAAMASKFLQIQHNRYLRGRSRENNKEYPLHTIKSEQQYIAYGKGTIAFNTLAHFVGVDSINKVLKSYLLNYQNETEIYPTSFDLLQMLKAATPDEFQYLIHDYFESIVLYKNNVKNVNTNEKDGKFESKISFNINKLDGSDDNNALPLNDFIEIGFYNEQNELFHIEQIKIQQVENEFTVTTMQKPDKVVLDPNLLLIELERTDYQVKPAN